MNTATGRDPWRFILYIAGEKPIMQHAESSLRRLCNEHLEGRHVIEVVDLFDLEADVPPDVLAVPTVIRVVPKPERRVVGDLSETAKAAEWLGLTEASLLDR